MKLITVVQRCRTERALCRYMEFKDSEADEEHKLWLAITEALEFFGKIPYMYTIRREILYRVAMNCYGLGIFKLKSAL